MGVLVDSMVVCKVREMKEKMRTFVFEIRFIFLHNLLFS